MALDTSDVGRRPIWLVSAAASSSAGAVHAAAVGAHADHPQVVWTFLVVAALQLGWGALALVRPSRAVAAGGAALGAAAFVGWVLAKTTGIPVVDGLDVVEPAQWADTVTALLAGLAGGTAGFALRPPSVAHPTVPARGPAAGLAVLVWIVSFPAMAAASQHHHDATHGEGAGHVHGGSAAHPHAAGAAVATAPYDPSRPIDLGGVEGVTPEQQARAENLVVNTLWKLPRFADVTELERLGYHSIGDAGTGYEHFVNWSLLDDGRQLDPDAPESVVFEVRGERRELVSAMYFAETGVGLDDVPDIGGSLTQWHVHGDLCFTADDPPRVAALRSLGQPCPEGSRDLGARPMIHVWVVPHRCGPFSALDGIGAGQVRAGEVASCDHAHGAH